MSLDDVFEETDPIQEAFDEVLFQKYLEILSELPDWKKKEVAKQLKDADLTFADVVRIFEDE